MSIIPLTYDNFEKYTINANTRRIFSSSSLGLTGSVKIFSRASDIEKEIMPSENFGDSPFGRVNLEEHRKYTVGLITGSSGSFNAQPQLEQYLDLVNKTSVSVTKQQRVDVIRFEPSFRDNKDTGRKRVIRNVLFPNYRHVYNSCVWAYPNYHTLNFFTSSNLPTSAVLMYPASSGTSGIDFINLDNPEGFPYSPATAFTFDFYINPRYTTDKRGLHYHAGTIMHLSSSYAISLVSGSSRDSEGRPDCFRIMLQLSHSAEIPPSLCSLQYENNRRNNIINGVSDNLVFLSSDNSLKFNHWHHIAIRWGGKSVNNGTGSFVIDGKIDKTFCIPSSSIMDLQFDPPRQDPDALFVGNFFEQKGDSGIIASFFNANVAYTDGLVSFFPNTEYDPNGTGPDYEDPASQNFRFGHPLNAEIHDLKIYASHKSIAEIVTGSQTGFSSIPNDLLFYVPPFFTKESPIRDVLQTPFQSYRTMTDDPFNVSLSFGIGGHQLNLPNFLREFVKGTYPRLYHLTASEIAYSQQTPESANTFLYKHDGLQKANLLILPNDNGLFSPKYEFLSSGTITDNPSSDSLLSKYVNDFGFLDYGLITLNNLVSTATLPNGLIDITNDNRGSILSALQGPTPEDPGIAPGDILTILNRTRDNSSNEVVFFDASNLFYGNKIRPGSITLTDPDVTGSHGKLGIQLKDNKRGGLYRADCLTKQAEWNEIGTVIYEEGIMAIKTPNIPIFGTDSWSIQFDGDYNVHVLEINVPCDKGIINSSSNPNWVKLKPSADDSDLADQFTYITGLNLHDENFNIVARVNLAQPVIKRDVDKYLFRVKLDF